MVQRVQRGQSTPILPIGKWTPDSISPFSEGLADVRNAIPKSDGFYGPENAYETFESSQITAVGSAIKFHGSLHSFPQLPSEPPRYFAGTHAAGAGNSRIVSRQEAGGWVNKSPAAGFEVSASTPWRFANFGAKILATNLSVPLHVAQTTSGNFAPVTDAPRGADIATVSGHAVMVNIVDNTFGEGEQPFYVWWSAAGDAENWPDPTSNAAISALSGFRPLLGGGRLQRIIPGIGGADAVIVASRKIFRMRFAGPGKVWEFDEIESDQGTNIPGSIAVFNETFFFFGHNKFLFFDGANARPIGAGVVDEFFINDADFSSTFGFQASVEAAIDTENKNYVISYRSRDALDDHNDRILRYNWLTDTWSVSNVACDVLGLMDSNAANTDSARLVLGGADFQLKRPTGSPLEAIFETNERMSPTGAVSEIHGIMPIVDTNAAVSRLQTRDLLGDSKRLTSEFAMQRTGWITFKPDRVTGRFYACRTRIPSGTEWTKITGKMYEMSEHSHGFRAT